MLRRPGSRFVRLRASGDERRLLAFGGPARWRLPAFGGRARRRLPAGCAGIVFVCAAGNDGLDNDVTPHYPSTYDCSNIIAVAATDSSDALASFSNWGPASVDLAPPGVGILSTVPEWLDSAGYESWDGTSMATPHVAGAMALMAAAYPSESMATRISTIEGSVDPLPGQPVVDSWVWPTVGSVCIVFRVFEPVPCNPSATRSPSLRLSVRRQRGCFVISRYTYAPRGPLAQLGERRRCPR